jgi:hypothetical protein
MLLTLEPPATTRLTTIERLRQEFPAITVSAASDTLVERWIDRASAMAVSFCNRPFAQALYREILSSPSGAILLERTPVEVVELTEGGIELAAGDDYWLDADTWQLRRIAAERETAWRGVVRIDYRGGYVVPGEEGANLPADVEYAVQLYVAAFFGSQASAASSSATGGLKRETVDGVGTREWYQESTTSGEASSSSGQFSPEDLLLPFRRFRL